ncbi:hypothetical protein TWF696_007015 [Orbilia brochopaga]|uniref:Uncharacterized protein n=1 Tax=Orbilia brochopaga TaxID=3140254 RepID=A0AAV9UTY4_9PEZI
MSKEPEDRQPLVPEPMGNWKLSTSSSSIAAPPAPKVRDFAYSPTNELAHPPLQKDTHESYLHLPAIESDSEDDACMPPLARPGPHSRKKARVPVKPDVKPTAAHDMSSDADAEDNVAPPSERVDKKGKKRVRGVDGAVEDVADELPPASVVDSSVVTNCEDERAEAAARRGCWLSRCFSCCCWCCE